jgi:hypothetical protein
MTTLNYESLSLPERKSAQRRAKRLLWTATAIAQPTYQPLAKALATAYLKPENVVAVVIHKDPEKRNRWYSDIVMRRGDRLVQVSEWDWFFSKKDALLAAKRKIGEIKGTKEHRILKIIRSQGLGHDEFGRRLFLVSEPAIAKGAENFINFVESCYGDLMDKVELARMLLLLGGPYFKADPAFLLAEEDMIDDAAHLQWNAAAYLLSNKITFVKNTSIGEEGFSSGEEGLTRAAFWQQVSKLDPALQVRQ